MVPDIFKYQGPIFKKKTFADPSHANNFIYRLQ
jgi:hypothetical protein